MGGKSCKLQFQITLQYESGKLNVEADALSRIPWGQEEELYALDTIVVKAIINRGYNGDILIPEVLQIPFQQLPKVFCLSVPQSFPNQIGKGSIKQIQT